MNVINTLILTCFAVFPYIFSLDGDFVFDDSEAIVKNTDVSLNQSIGTIFNHDFWGTDIKSNVSHKSYRPLTILSFRLNKYISNDALVAKDFKITNLLLHALVTIMVYQLMLNILSPRSKINSSLCNKTCKPSLNCKYEQFTSAFIFAIHPIHVEAVSGIVGRADILAALFYLIAIINYHKIISNIISNTSTMLHFGIVFLFTTLSTLCKEIGITAMVFCSIYDTILEFNFEFEAIKLKNISKTVKKFYWRHNSWIGRQCILFLATAFLFYARYALMNFEAPQFQVVDNPAAFNDSLIIRIATYNYIYFVNLLILIWPQWLCFDWSMGCIPLVESLGDRRFFFVALLWICIVFILRKLCSQSTCIILKKKLTIMLSLLVIPFLPAANILMPVGFVVAERILYIPSIGFSALISIGWYKILKFLNTKYKMIVYFLFIIYINIMIIRTYQRSQEWLNETSLFNSALPVCPLNAKVHYNIGKNAADNKNYTLAEYEYREAIRLNTDYYQAMNNLANLLKDQSRFKEAEGLLRRAIEIKSDFPAAWMNLGVVWANLHNYDDAERAYFAALRFKKNYADCYYNLGNLYLERKLYDKALKAWAQATKINPYHKVAWSNTLSLLDNSGRISEGLKFAPLVLSLLPNDPSIHFNVGNLMGKNGDFVNAENHFLTAITLKKVQVPSIYYINLGVLYHRWKKLNRAAEMYKKALLIDPHSKSAQQNLQSLKL